MNKEVCRRTRKITEASRVGDRGEIRFMYNAMIMKWEVYVYLRPGSPAYITTMTDRDLMGTEPGVVADVLLMIAERKEGKGDD